MKEIKKEERNETLIKALLNVWENSVRETHLFLSNEEIEKPITFMGIENQKLEMLFITSEYRGKGIGKKMLLYGIENYKVNDLAVNEENPQAKGFYEYMGFKVYQRNELDDQGNPYPILYMKLER